MGVNVAVHTRHIFLESAPPPWGKWCMFKIQKRVVCMLRYVHETVSVCQKMGLLVRVFKTGIGGYFPTYI